MKSKFDTKSTICGALLGAAVVFTIGAAVNQPRIEWEYSAETVKYESHTMFYAESLNRIASKGREIVSVSLLPGPNNQDVTASVILRRAKP